MPYNYSISEMKPKDYEETVGLLSTKEINDYLHDYHYEVCKDDRWKNWVWIEYLINERRK